jgi:hypothetical protein
MYTKCHPGMQTFYKSCKQIAPAGMRKPRNTYTKCPPRYADTTEKCIQMAPRLRIPDKTHTKRPQVYGYQIKMHTHRAPCMRTPYKKHTNRHPDMRTLIQNVYELPTGYADTREIHKNRTPGMWIIVDTIQKCVQITPQVCGYHVRLPAIGIPCKNAYEVLPRYADTV